MTQLEPSESATNLTYFTTMPWHGYAFRVIVHLWWESTRDCNTGVLYSWCQPEQAVGQIIQSPVTEDGVTHKWQLQNLDD